MSTEEQPQIVVLSGPNGAGKSTVAPTLIRDTLGISQFVNADLIAAGLSPFAPLAAAFQAGELMLRRIHELATRRLSFAFETTLASRTYASFLSQQRNAGYLIHLVYIRLETPELAIDRVADRVRQGGHDVPSEIVRRRYNRGLANLAHRYLSLADTWIISDNSGTEMRFIAEGQRGVPPVVYDEGAWKAIREFSQ